MTNMDVDKAAKMTYELAQQYQPYWTSGSCYEMGGSHLDSMMKKWNDNMSYGKKCRWLGWMQAMVVQALYPKVTMQTMREININCTERKTNG